MGQLMRPLNVPEKEIRFAAKTGFLSKPLWDEFFAAGTDRWRRKQWQFFLERGLFRKHPSRLPTDVFVLHRKNPMVIRLVGEQISLPPFAPQIEHDEVAAKILLSLERTGHALGYRVEAEIKREEFGQRQRYSGTDKMKYPDAILEIADQGGVTKVALEIELSRKNPKRYRHILNTYAARKELKYVLFLARARTIFESLKTAMRETYYPDWERPIGFCDVDEWLKNPATAAIHFSERVTTLEKIRSDERKEIHHG